MKKRVIFVLFAFVSLTCSSQNVFGGFVGGIERFNGTTKDSTTWEEYPPPPNSRFSQNNSLELALDPGSLFISDYTTKNIMIGVGQAVSVEIRNCQVSTLPSSGSSCGLYLTNNSEGTSNYTIWDSAVLGLEYSYYVSSKISEFFPSYGGSGYHCGTGFATGTPPPTPSDPYIFTIERLTSNSAFYSVHHKNTMALIGSQTLSFSSIDDNLYISLMANVYAVWDNVTVIPEPSSLCLILLGATMLFRKRRP